MERLLLIAVVIHNVYFEVKRSAFGCTYSNFSAAQRVNGEFAEKSAFFCVQTGNLLITKAITRSSTLFVTDFMGLPTASLACVTEILGITNIYLNLLNP